MNRKDLNRIIGRTMRAIQTAKNDSARKLLGEAVRNLNDARRALHAGSEPRARRMFVMALSYVRLARAA